MTTKNVPWKLFIGQVPKTVTETELTQIFEPYGNIEELTVHRDKITGNHKGCAFLIYEKREEAEAAIAALHNNKVLPPLTNPMQVKFADDKEDKGDWKLFVGMVPKAIVESDMREVFEAYGNIEELHILRDYNGNSKGCGFVKFSTRAEAQAAINALNGKYRFPSYEDSPPIVVKYADTQKAKEMKQRQQFLQQQQQQMISAALSPYGNIMPPIYPPLASPAMGGLPMPAAQPYYPAPIPQLPGAPPVPYAPVPNVPAQAPVNHALALQHYLSNYAAQTQYPPLPSASTTNQSEGPPGANLFIYHLPQDFTDNNLMMLFMPFGNIVSAKVFIDKLTGQSKCFGFVSFDSPDAAQNAIAQMNGYQIGLKRLKVQLKRSQAGARPY